MATKNGSPLPLGRRHSDQFVTPETIMDEREVRTILYDLIGRIKALESQVAQAQSERAELRAQSRAESAEVRADIANLEKTISELKLSAVDYAARRVWIEKTAFLLIGALITVLIGVMLNIAGARGFIP